MESQSTTPRSKSIPVGEGSDVDTTDASKLDDAASTHERASQSDTTQTMPTPKLVLLFVSVLTSMFLVGLDRSIISTAIPRITDEFHSLPDVGWYNGAYLLTCCAFQLLYGKIYTFYSIKYTLLASILLFEIGSAICGAAPNSVAFIIGRAISGIGAAGVFAGTITCIVHTVPLDRRSQVQGLFGALFGLASIVGPLIGGAFTSNVTWRWCFYLNLPIGAVSMLIVFFCLDVPDRDTTKLPWQEKLAQLDAPGTSVLVPGVVCLLLALQWGGQTYSWSNGRIIALLVLAGVFLVAFCAAQALLPKTATIHPRIFKQRSIIAACWATICIGSSQYIYSKPAAPSYLGWKLISAVFFLPVWFQAIKGVSAVDSGIRLLPLMLSSVVAMILGGAINRKVGYYTALAIIGSCVMTIGSGLLYTLDVHSGKGKWIGYQIVYGLGSGFCFQTPNLAAQTVLPKRDAPVGLALMFFASMMGSAVFIAVGQNVLGNELVKRLAGLPGLDLGLLVTDSGATELLSSLPANLRETGLKEYNGALQQVFLIGLILSCLVIPGAAAMEWRSILHKPQEEVAAESNQENAEEKEETGGNSGERKTRSV